MPPALGAGCPDEVVASIPVGPDGVSYELEIEPWGPAALAVGPDGGLYVLDGPGHSVVVVNAGEMTRLSLEDTGVFALFDLAFVEGQLWVLGEGVFFRHGFGSRLVRFSARGDFDMAIDFPDVGLSDGVIGPGGRAGGPAVGGVGGRQRRRGAGSASRAGHDPGLPLPRWPLVQSLGAGGLGSLPGRGHRGRSPGAAGFDRIGVQLLGVNPDGSFVLMATESGEADDLSRRVAMSVLWFDAGGERRGEAELPLEEQFLHVTHPAALGPDGCVYYLLTGSDEVEVLRMAWQPPG